MLDKLALQLYSVREDTAKDFPGTLEKVAKMGYTGVEFAGFFGISAEQMAGYLKSNGLECVSSHVGGDDIFDAEKLKATIQYHNAIGSRYIVCPGTKFTNRAETLAVAEQFNTIAEKCAQAGIKFGYHNHSHEFEKDGDEYLLDILFSNTSSDVIMELDVFWAELMGIETVKYLIKWYGRATLVHLKQLGDRDKKNNVNAGDGILDFAEIIKYGKYHGITDFVYEQEEYGDAPINCVADSAKYILSLKE